MNRALFGPPAADRPVNRYSLDRLGQIARVTGVYLFFDQAGRLLYIGKAKDLASRVRSYFGRHVERGPKVLEMIPAIDHVETIATESEVEAVLLEAELVRRHLPPANTDLKDQKSFLMLVWFEHAGFPTLQFVRQRDLGLSRAGQLGGLAIKRHFGPFVAAGEVKAAMKVIRKVLPYRDCVPSKFERYRQLGRPCLYGFLKLCPAPCVGRITEASYRRRVADLNRLLAGRRRLLTTSLTRQMRAAARRQDFESASLLRDQLAGLDHLNEVSLLDSERALPGQAALRLEAFDISTLFGSNAVGSLVVFRNDRPERSAYRRFRIKGPTTAGDLQMMTEVLERRLSRSLNVSGETRWPLPDLWLIDGGRDHLTVAKRVQRRYGVTFPIIAVAKGRRRRNADLCFSQETETRLLLKAFDFDRLVRHLRDEAHRFAITYHRGQRSRQAFRSLFDDIPGLGPVSRSALLKHFGSVAAVRTAAETELAAVVGRSRAATLYRHLHTKDGR